MKGLSVVIPAYNEEEMISIIANKISRQMAVEKIPFEVIFVSDGSSDGTWGKIQEESKKSAAVRGLEFSRNFGKDAAILAGLAQSRMDAVAVMDCDLQHPVEALPQMYRLWLGGVQVVEGVKRDRGRENVIHRGGARGFYRILSRAMGMDMENASDFKLLDRNVVEHILEMPEQHLVFRAISSWTGYSTARVEYQVGERVRGDSKWRLGALITYGLRNIVAFTTVPLQFVTVAGVVCLAGSLLLAIYSLIRYFQGQAVEGYTTLLLVLLVIGSGVMISLGIIGFYIGRIYDEVRRRPRYLIARMTCESETVREEET